MKKLFIWIGLIRVKEDGSIRWPLSFPRWNTMRYYWKTHPWPYVFTCPKGTIKWVKGRLLPRRWGVGWLGVEFGDRG